MGKKIDLTNQQFNYLTVIKPTDKRSASGSILWLCQCKCGNTTLATSTELKSGHKQSCGCYQKKIIKQIGQNNLINLVGKRYNNLLVIEKSKTIKTNNGSTKIFWKCVCDCGNICEVEGQSLKSGNTKSCGCLKSSGEQKIKNLLQENNIFFETEKIFEDNKPYRYDFYINNKYIIEYDGKQHFQENSWGSKPEQLKTIKERDKIKNEYCFNNNIPIIRIPYTHYDNLKIEDLLLETSNFILSYL